MNNVKNSQIYNPLFNAGLEFQKTFFENKWLFCFIGAIAVLRWGDLRMTQDIGH